MMINVLPDRSFAQPPVAMHAANHVNLAIRNKSMICWLCFLFSFLFYLHAILEVFYIHKKSQFSKTSVCMLLGCVAWMYLMQMKVSLLLTSRDDKR